MSNCNDDKRLLRKLDHIKLALDLAEHRRLNGFEDVTLVHQALPELNLSQIDLSCFWLGKKLSAPILINAITGGAECTGEINASLARISKKFGLAMAVGSQTAAIKDKKLAKTFKITRRENNSGVVLANISAGAPYPEVLEAIDMIEADGVQLHLNALQESIMPEGERNFTGVINNITSILERSPVPVIIKEVGFGLSREAAHELSKIGISYLDIGGYGGTNFAIIESARNSTSFGQAFKNWGIPTAASLLEARSIQKPAHITATGGIHTGVEICKALRLGADIIGMAGFFLSCLMKNNEDVLSKVINNLLNELRIAMLLIKASNLSQIRKAPIVISGELQNWVKLRQLNI